MINKKEFVEVLAKEMGKTQKETLEIVDKVFNTLIAETLSSGGVKISGFGQFEVVERAAREGRNPQTGESIKIDASKAIKFKISKGFKDAVKGE